MSNRVLRSSVEQRSRLGQLNVAPELWTAILTHLTDLTSVVCFGAAHPLLSCCALERMRDIMMSFEGVGAWAGHRLAFVDEDYRLPLPQATYTEAEWRKYDVENKGLLHSKQFIDVGGNPDADHRDEWLARGGKDYHTASYRSEGEAPIRWERAKFDTFPQYYSDIAHRMDYWRVHKLLDHTEHVVLYRLRAGEYALCNEDKREYVLAQSVAKFNSHSDYSGPFVKASWTLGDTAGFLVACDPWLIGENSGEGRWAGNRICVTTLDLMKDMEGPGEWKDIGLFASDDEFEGDELWGQIDKYVGILFSYGEGDWKDNYRPA